MDFSDFEIIILPDADIGTVPALAKILSTKGTVPIRIVPTGPVSPAQKRDMALNYARGETLAFLDDDAYPARDWLKKALENFKDPDVAAVGGPGVTPFNDAPGQKASGLVYSSFLVSAGFSYRYMPEKRREVDDFPSCNFFVRQEIFRELGGFKTNFWPGEDTKLCLEITKKLGKKIIYDPFVMAWHHRRPLFLPHLKQIASYALHRGYFVKKYPQTSFKVSYFIPALFLICLITGGILAMFLPFFRWLYFTGIILYLFLVFIFTPLEILSRDLKNEKFLTGFSLSKELGLLPMVFLGIIFTHLVYGFYFLKGLLAKKLWEER